MTAASLPAGSAERGARSEVALRIFDAPSEELLRTLKPPWPRSLRRLYELHEAATPAIDVRKGVVTLGAAVAALREQIANRLGVLTFVVTALEELGWDVRLEGEVLLAGTDLTPAEALVQLEDHGIAGPMCVIAELDELGWPLIQAAGEAEGA